MSFNVTNSYNFAIISTGQESGTWGSDLNTFTFSPLDLILGGTVPVTLTSSNVTLTLTQWTSGGAFLLTGTLTTNVTLSLPLSPNSVGSALGVGGKFVVSNQCTGNFTVTVLTAATSSTGVVVPQGTRSSLYSDTVNVWFADDSRAASIIGFAGNPNGSVAGTAANTASGTPASLVLNTSTNQPYVCTTTGNAGSAVWSLISPFVPSPQGYITPVSNLPIIVSDQTVTTIFYTPYVGSICPIFNGSVFVPVTFSQLSLALSSSFQAAGGIYDVYVFLNGGVVTAAFSPSWAAGSGGSNSPPCVRGTGAGSAQLNRLSGIFVNAFQQTMNNGASTFTVPANQGTYVGSIFTDFTPGQVTCNRSAGSARKFGIWNAYNRAPIMMAAFDATASWSYNSATIRPSNNNTGNSIFVFTGLAEEQFDLKFVQTLSAQSSSGFLGQGQIGIGVGVTNAFTGKTGTVSCPSTNTITVDVSADCVAEYQLAQLFGWLLITSCEKSVGSISYSASGTASGMQLSAQYRG